LSAMIGLWLISLISALCPHMHTGVFGGKMQSV